MNPTKQAKSMKEKQKTVYYCDHCKKHGLSRHHMVNHEKFCSLNPENANPCSGCIFMEEREQEYIVSYNAGDGDFEDKFKTTKAYFCTAKQQRMHPLQAERRNLPSLYPETFDGSILFPKECDQKKYHCFTSGEEWYI
jgi:hypothetical protein